LKCNRTFVVVAASTPVRLLDLQPSVFPGETVEGTLIGAAEAGIPEDRPNVSAELVVFDACGHDYHLPAVLAVLRKKKPKGLDRPKPVRSPENPGRLEKWFEEVNQKWLKEGS
jgi:hypothetical protein